MPAHPDRPRGGRPPKAPTERRTAAVLVRLTPAEHAAVQVRAKEARRALSTFIREAALGVAIKVPRSRVNAEAIHQLGRVGNNLNQLAREANAGRLTHLEQRLTLALAEVNAAVEQVIDVRTPRRTPNGPAVRYPTAEEADAAEDGNFWEPGE